MSYNRSLLSQITKDLNKKPSKPKVPKNQWQHPGEITNIPSNSITMDAVSYPVLGVPNVGQPQMMYPDQQYYYPDADNVTEYPMMGSGGYVVTRSNDRKGKTHKVTGPDGTVKYFGDSSMGQHPKDPKRKKAFYARHKKNLENNPFFRAFARKTWAEGGQTSDEREMVNGIADILSQVEDRQNRAEIARQMMSDFNRDNVTYNAQSFLDMAELKNGGEMIRRADGSYSRRGLWDNIRANKGSGKKPTKEMLEQERKIKSKMQFGGLWDSNRTAWVDSVNNANMDKNFVQRMYNPNAPQMFLPGDKRPSTHFMESGDARVYPTVVQRPGNKFVEWLNQRDPRAAYNYAMDTGQYIQFPNDEQATWYGANGYKQGTNVVTGKKKMQPGGQTIAYPDNTRLGNVAKHVRPGNYRGQMPDTLGENIFEIIDPTGISSWDDVYRSAVNPNSTGYDTAIEFIGAIPMLGKLAKLSSPGIHLGKYKGLDRTLYDFLPRNKVVSHGISTLGKVGRGSDAYQAYDQYKQYGGVMKKYQKAGQVRSKDGYIDIAKIYPEVGDNTIDKDWVEKAEMLNKMYPNSRFVCTAKGCADIATSFARAKGYDFGRNHAWLLGNQNPVVWTNPNYEGMIESDRELLPNPTSYAVPEYLQSLDAGYLVGLNRINNSLDASGRKAKGKAARATSQEKSNDSGDYGPRLYPGSRKYEHTGYINEPGQLVHGTGAGAGHPSYLVFDNMKNGIQLNGIGKYEPVEAMEEASWFNKGINWLKNLQQGGSIYDYMTQRGLNASFANRKKMFDQYFNGNYTGSAEQNLKMMQMLQGQQQRFQQVRPNVAFPTPGVQAAVPFRNVASASRQMPPVPKGMQRVTNKIDNRNWLYKLLNVNEDEVKNTDFILPQDVAGYYNQYHDTNKGKKFGIVSKQNSRGYFFDEDGNLVLQDEVGLGSDAGDAQPIFYKVRTTPSGEYKVTKTNKIGKVADIASQYGSNNFFTMEHIDPNKRLIPDPKDPNRAVTAALHGVPVALEKQRLPLFGDNNVKNNRMSAGCINCRKSTLNKPYFTNIPYNQGMSLYVTPDKKHGGQLSLGQEIDVTPEEMFELKRQGYTFDII